MLLVVVLEVLLVKEDVVLDVVLELLVVMVSVVVIEVLLTVELVVVVVGFVLKYQRSPLWHHMRPSSSAAATWYLFPAGPLPGSFRDQFASAKSRDHNSLLWARSSVRPGREDDVSANIST